MKNTKKTKKMEKIEVVNVGSVGNQDLMNEIAKALEERQETEPVTEIVLEPVSVEEVTEVPMAVTEYDKTPVEFNPLVEEEPIQDFESLEPSIEDTLAMFLVKPEITKKTKKAKTPKEPKAKMEVVKTSTPVEGTVLFRDKDRNITFTVDGKKKSFKGNWTINHNGQLLYSGGKGIMIKGDKIEGLRRFKSTGGDWSSWEVATPYVSYSTENIKTYEDLWSMAYTISFIDEYLFIQVKAPRLPKVAKLPTILEKVEVVTEEITNA